MESYRTTFTIKRLWLILGASMIVMFATLLFFGREIYHQAPPIPEQYETTLGETLFTRADIERGQNVWQSLGGMQQGSVWGHGSYLAPDWSADWLQREAEALLSNIANENPVPQSVTAEQMREIHKVSLRLEMRKNTHDPTSGTVTISPLRAAAINLVRDHYKRLFQASDESSRQLRKDYAFPANALLTDDEADALSAFFFWTAWSATTNRPDDDVTYTSNWPHEPLVGNAPTASVLMWSILSVIFLLGGIGALVWYYVRQYDVWRADMEPEGGVAREDDLATATITPSMRATAKYFWVVVALFLAQVLLGIITAHYAVEGQGFYGLPLAEYFFIFRDAHMAHSACNIVDCGGLAGGRSLCRAIACGARTKVPALWREFSVYQSADYRGGVVCR